jgi:hypothetical protein
VSSEVLTEVLLKFLVFKDVVLCWLGNTDQHFKGFKCLLLVLIDSEYRGIRVLGNMIDPQYRVIRVLGKISNSLPINMA